MATVVAEDHQIAVITTGVVSPHSYIVQIIFYFWSFEIMECILKAEKLIIG